MQHLVIPPNSKMSFSCHNYGIFAYWYDHIDFYAIKSSDFLRNQPVHYRI